MNKEKKIEAPSIIINSRGDLGKTEEFKRPDHTDFMTGSELSKKEFSGVRLNSLTDVMEIWIQGRIAGSMPAADMQLWPEKWENLYRDVFGLNDVTAGSR